VRAPVQFVLSGFDTAVVGYDDNDDVNSSLPSPSSAIPSKGSAAVSSSKMESKGKRENNRRIKGKPRKGTTTNDTATTNDDPKWLYDGYYSSSIWSSSSSVKKIQFVSPELLAAKKGIRQTP
jgi:CCR4-NOT transcriptional regulation complex NOT5 subunit